MGACCCRVLNSPRDTKPSEKNILDIGQELQQLSQEGNFIQALGDRSRRAAIREKLTTWELPAVAKSVANVNPSDLEWLFKKSKLIKLRDVEPLRALIEQSKGLPDPEESFTGRTHHTKQPAEPPTGMSHQLELFDLVSGSEHDEFTRTDPGNDESVHSEPDVETAPEQKRPGLERLCSPNPPSREDTLSRVSSRCLDAPGNDQQSEQSTSTRTNGPDARVMAELLKKVANGDIPRKATTGSIGHGRRTVADTNNEATCNVTSEVDSQLARILKDGVANNAKPSTIRRLAHFDEYQHSNPVPLALFLMMFFIIGVVVLRFTRSSAEPKKRCRKATAMKTEGRNSRSL